MIISEKHYVKVFKNFKFVKTKQKFKFLDEEAEVVVLQGIFNDLPFLCFERSSMSFKRCS